MQSRSFVFAALAALLLFTSLPTTRLLAAEPRNATVAPLPAVDTDDGRFGMVQGIVQPDMAWQAGARWDRIIFPWSLIQKDGPNSWTQLYFTDEAIKAQARRGVTMAGILIYTPQWASTTPEKGRPVDPPRGLELNYKDPNNLWGQFVRKVVERHKGVVDHWIVWNEPDLYTPGLRYTFDGSFEQYAQLLKVAYLNAKEINPDSKIIVGGFAYWWDKEHNRPPFLGPLLEVIGRDPDRAKNNHYFDIVSVHTYTAPLNSFAEPMVMKDILDNRSMKKPIWIGESNVIPHDDPQNPLPAGQMRASLDQQASYVIQSMAMAVAADVERYAIYKATDEKAENDTELWGLIRNNGTAKPAYVAYQVGAKYFADVQSAIFSWPGKDKPALSDYHLLIRSNEIRTQFIWPAQVAQVAMERGDHRTTVAWNTSPEPVTHNIPANSKQATLVYKDGKTETIKAKNGVYSVELPPSTHNADPRDPSIYMIGGDPLIVDEQVMALPTTRLASRIEIVWPFGSAPLEEASKANVTAQLLMPNTTTSVACRYDPEKVELYAWRHYEDKPKETQAPVIIPSPSAATPTSTPTAAPERVRGEPKREKDPVLLATGAKRFATENGVTYPVWDFNDVDVSYARTADKDRWLEMFVAVDGIKMDPAPWIYGGDDNKNWQDPRPVPSEGCR
ncbi:MAG: glycosyl hydrolase [Chloroflexota bacterium]